MPEREDCSHPTAPGVWFWPLQPHTADKPLSESPSGAYGQSDVPHGSVALTCPPTTAVSLPCSAEQWPQEHPHPSPRTL